MAIKSSLKFSQFLANFKILNSLSERKALRAERPPEKLKNYDKIKSERDKSTRLPSNILNLSLR